LLSSFHIKHTIDAAGNQTRIGDKIYTKERSWGWGRQLHLNTNKKQLKILGKTAITKSKPQA
jgi:hypothetical protein